MITSERLPLKGVSHLPMHIEDIKQTYLKTGNRTSELGIMLARPNDYCNFRGGWGLSLQTWVAPAGSIPAIADSLSNFERQYYA
jgi:hypothetical protein